MSSTRKAEKGTPMAQSRWMSDPIFVERRPISGLCTAQRAQLVSGELRRLLFWIQGRSLEPDGLAGIASELLASFPDHVSVWRPVDASYQVGVDTKSGAVRSIEEIDVEVLSPMEQEAWRANLRQRLRAEIPAFLMRLCVDPGMRMPGEQRVRVPDSMTVAELPGFKDVVSCLVAIMNRSRRDASAGTAVTSVGKIVSDHLDFCRNTREMVVICGREGIGKTAAMTTWLKRNEGDVRRITLTATNNQTEFFRALASTLGVAASYTRKVDEMKGRCADMLQSSGLMLVIDEAHQILPRGKRVETTPVLLEWIYSALRDEGVPVALVCTPQFRIWAANIQKRTGWNADQFLRRTKRFRMLPDRLNIEDLRSVAAAIAPKERPEILEAAIAYANSKEHQLDGLVDILREARIAAEEAGRTSIRAPDIKRAMTEVIEPCLVAKQWNVGRPRRDSPLDAAVDEPLQRSCEPGAGPAQPLCGAGRRENFLEVSVGEG